MLRNFQKVLGMLKSWRLVLLMKYGMLSRRRNSRHGVLCEKAIFDS